jgi:hypothetical protein
VVIAFSSSNRYLLARLRRLLVAFAIFPHPSMEIIAFVYADNDSGRVTTILAYPTEKLAKSSDWKISNMFG